MTSPNRKSPALSSPLDPTATVPDIPIGSGSNLLTLWEQGKSAAPPYRGTALLAAASGESFAAAGSHSIGARDRRLLELRRELISDWVEARTACPQCGTEIESRFPLSDMLSEPATENDTITIALDGLSLVVRAPSALELEQLTATQPNERALRQAIVQLCIVSCVDSYGCASALPDSVDSAIAKAIEQLDPLAAISVQLSCPDCGVGFEMPFDPADFVWREVTFAAERLLWEVDQIARVYHWSETDILAMTPTRRQAYLGMVLA